MPVNEPVIIKPFSTTGIGSLPHHLPDEAASLALSTFDIPFWPQLPEVSFRELMIPQYTEGMPSVRMDEGKRRIWVERDEEEIARFYETCGEDAKIAMSEEYAAGLHAFLRLARGRRFQFLKGHITGPLTFTLGLNDPEGKPIYFDEELRELSLMLLQAKARWQVEVLGQHAGGVVIFIDEPILSALGGTSYMGVSAEETMRLLSETSRAIRQAGGIPGIHCCGRAEWPMVMRAGVDIMNFDAYEFGDTLNIYPGEVRAFLEGGGYLAWGMVPTTDKISEETEESISGLFQRRLEAMSRDIPPDLILSRIILTPSCGTGSMSVGQTQKVFQILMRLKEAVSA
jgi:hypothetical protein